MFIRLDHKIYMVAGGSSGPGISNFKDCNVYLCVSDEDAFLIDGGSGLDTSLIIKNIEETGFNINNIRYLFLTHAHGDHGSGILDFKQRIPNIKIVASSGEGILLEQGTDEQLGLIAAKKKGAYPLDFEYKHCKVDITLKDHDTFNIGTIKITAIIVPGHSIESTCYLVEMNSKKYLFSGDTIYLNGTLSLLNCFGSSMEGYRKNLKKLANLGVDALIPSHFRLTMTCGQEHIDKAIALLEYSSLPPMM